MTRDEVIEYIVREARVAAEQMIDKKQPIHLFDFGVMKEGGTRFSVLIVTGETKILEAWAMLMKGQE